MPTHDTTRGPGILRSALVLPFPVLRRDVPLPHGGGLTLWEGWLSPDEEHALLATLLRDVPFRQDPIRLFGRTVLQPRLVAWYGDPTARYTYSGLTLDPLPWLPALAALRPRVEAAAATGFQAVLVNQYRDGADSMGFHADDEPELGPDPVVASLSLGATRRFVLVPKAKSQGAERLALALPGGSLLVMHAGTQAAYRHGVPKDAHAGRRINLTFRSIVRP